MVGVVLDTERLPISFGVLQCSRDEVRLRVDGTEVAERERVVESRVVNGTPEVDYLESALEERLGVDRRKVPVDSGDRGGGRLVDVYTSNWLAFLRSIIDFSRTAATNCWKEKEKSTSDKI